MAQARPWRRPGRAAGPAVAQIGAGACDQLARDSDFTTTIAFRPPVTVTGELAGIPAADRDPPERLPAVAGRGG